MSAAIRPKPGSWAITCGLRSVPRVGRIWSGRIRAGWEGRHLKRTYTARRRNRGGGLSDVCRVPGGKGHKSLATVGGEGRGVSTQHAKVEEKGRLAPVDHLVTEPELDRYTAHMELRVEVIIKK